MFITYLFTYFLTYLLTYLKKQKEKWEYKSRIMQINIVTLTDWLAKVND